MCPATPCGRHCRHSPGKASSSSNRDAGHAWQSSRSPARRAVRGARGTRGTRRQPRRDVLGTDVEVAAMRVVVDDGREAAERGNLAALPALNTRFHTLLADHRPQRDAGRDDRAPAPPHRVDLLAAHRTARAALVERAQPDRRCHRQRRRQRRGTCPRAPTSRWRGRRTSISAKPRADCQKPLTAPPSTRTTAPVMNDARALQRNVTTSASSSAWPNRARGMPATCSSRTSSTDLPSWLAAASRSGSGRACRTDP